MINLILVLALVSSIFMAISIGASAVPPAFGPVRSSGITGILKSVLIAGIAASIGAFLQGGNVTNTIGSGIVSGGLMEIQALTILLVAAALVIIGVIFKFPIPTAFTVVGAVVGSGLSYGNAIQFGSLGSVVSYWIVITFVATGLSFALAKILRYYTDKESSQKKIKYLTLLLGIFVAYTSGANSVGLAVGPLQSLNFSLFVLLLLGSISILVGALIFSPKIVDAVSFEYSNIGPRRSAAGLATAVILAQIGVFLGIPISFNEVVIFSVIGSGMVVGKSNVGAKKLGYTVGAWISSFFVAIFATYCLGEVLQYLLA